MKLVLFDIDGTLIDPARAGTRSANRAFEDLFSIRDAFEGISMAGKTDVQIFKQGLAAHGLSHSDGIIPRLLSRYLVHLENEIRTPLKSLKPGVRDLLNVMKDNKNCLLGLLTGNIEPGARIKLGAFRLNGFFASGAFGDDHEDRNSLLPFAVQKYRGITGERIESRDCIVIGDTPADVTCAKVHGAAAIAVSTGPYGAAELNRTDADHVLEDLSGAAALLGDLCRG